MRVLLLLLALAPAAEAEMIGATWTPRTSAQAEGLRLLLALRAAREGGGEAILRQDGRDNAALLRQSGEGNLGVVVQRGRGHRAGLDQSGGGNAGLLVQIGRGAAGEVLQSGGDVGVTLQIGF